MAFVIKDRVRETTTTTGTSAISLGGTSTSFESFSDHMSNADTTHYAIVHSTADEWEVGLGTWNTGNTLTRTTVLSSSNSNAAVNFTSGSKDVFMTYPASQAVSNLPLSGGTLTGDLSLGDNDKAIFGAGNDLQIYHDETASYVSEQGAGPLNVLASQLNIYNATETSKLAQFNSTSSKLFHNNSEKLATTSTGIDVTGNIAVSGTVDGRDIATNIPSSLGTAGQVLAVNSGATATEWADASGGGGGGITTGKAIAMAMVFG